MRLDQKLVEIGHFPSRSRARDAVVRGCVHVDGKLVQRPGVAVGQDVKIQIDDPAADYVSRAALKLIAGFQASRFVVEGKSCLDIGASTGGFTQVLLEHSAAHVTAIDVGHGQMVASIADDPRVSRLEGINARDLVRETLMGREIEFIVSDVSFISLKLALPPALALAAPHAQGIFLIKPQFEAGREHVGKGGRLRDPGYGLKVAKEIAMWMDRQDGWRHTHLLLSPIVGSDGNQEYLLCARKSGNGNTI